MAAITLITIILVAPHFLTILHAAFRVYEVFIVASVYSMYSVELYYVQSIVRYTIK